MSARNRLLLAAALCAVGLGLPWGLSAAYTGWVSSRLVIVPSVDWDGYYTTGTALAYDWISGDRRAAAPGAASDERVVLVPAAAAFAAAALRPSASSRRWATVAAVALGVIAVLGLARGIPGGPLAALLAVVLVRPALRSMNIDGGRAVAPSPG